MDRVKKLIEAGLTIPAAIREAIGVPLSQFAEKAQVNTPDLSAAINGAKRPTERILFALISEFGGTEDEWRELLWLAGKPEPSTPATT
jgi:transcriptional regulator with XRE-family HTH domain